MKKTSIFICIMALLSACDRQLNNKEQGAITGGILGGLLGTQLGDGKTSAFVSGSIIGAMIGANVGEKLDESNRHELSKALTSLPANRSRSWVDRHYGYNYTVTPIKSFYRGAVLCRRYRVTVMVNGQLKHGVGRACQHNSEDWYIVD